MKTQISRLSPHQNGKVLGIVMAITTLLVGVPVFTFIFFMDPNESDKPRNIGLFVPYIFAIVYLVFGYLTGLIGSAVYNVLYKYIGGFEFEQKDRET